MESFQKRKYFNDFNYDYIHTSYYENAGSVAGQGMAIQGGNALYRLFTGSEPDGHYSLAYSWDKTHKEDHFLSYLSFSQSGQLMQIFHSYPEDRIYLSKLGPFGIGTTPEIDISYIMYSPYASPDLYAEILSQCLGAPEEKAGK